MFDLSSVVVGLEIGTSKICAVVADVAVDGTFRVLGLGQAESKGVRKGEIVNPADLPELLRHAVKEAEEMADVEVRSVWLGVTGGHIQETHNKGFHPIASDDREITEDDVDDVLRIAKTLNLPAHNHPIHLIRQHFGIDGQVTENPVRMYGNRLEADVLVLHGNFNRLQGAIRAVKSLNIEVEDVAFNGLASQLAVLTAEQKELGTLLLDMGAGTTEYVVTEDGIVHHAGVLAVGGDHVSQDLVTGLRIPLGLAEQLKVKHGSASLDDPRLGDTLQLPSGNGLAPRSINREHFHRIMHARLEETLQIIEQKLADAVVLSRLHGGVVLTGGCSQTAGLLQLAESVFQLPVQLGQIRCVAGMNESVNQPEFATPVGLAKFGSFRVQRQLASRARFNVRRTLTQLFGR
ncbi:MAG: cell division protein FtsA [Pedosphaera sp.]|nr:cell division protein FtsA [Pedosphaera sp.]